jgi:hypothetical protein
MLRKAKDAALPIDEAAMTACDHKINPGAPLKPPKDFVANEYRGFLKGDRYHFTVQIRPDHNNPPTDFVHETEEDETHASRITDLERRTPDAAE